MPRYAQNGDAEIKSVFQRSGQTLYDNLGATALRMVNYVKYASRHPPAPRFDPPRFVNTDSLRPLDTSASICLDNRALSYQIHYLFRCSALVWIPLYPIRYIGAKIHRSDQSLSVYSMLQDRLHNRAKIKSP
jgi:hypothetical protein